MSSMIETTEELDSASEPVQASRPGAVLEGLLHGDDVPAELKPLATEGEPNKGGEASPSEADSRKGTADISVDVENERIVSEQTIGNSGEVEPAPADFENNRDLSGTKSMVENECPVQAIDEHSDMKQDEAKVAESVSVGEPASTEMNRPAEDTLLATPEVKPSSEAAYKEVTEEPNNEELSVQSEIADDISGKPNSSPMVESAHKKESDDNEGAEESSFAHPVDEEQPFVSEQFEDETETIIGEGSLIGDNDGSDTATNADSVPCSPRSTTDEIANALPSCADEGSPESAPADSVPIEESKASSESDRADLLQENINSLAISDNDSVPQTHEPSSEIQAATEQEQLSHNISVAVSSPHVPLCFIESAVKDPERPEVAASGPNNGNFVPAVAQPFEHGQPAGKYEVGYDDSQTVERNNQTDTHETEANQIENVLVSVAPVLPESDADAPSNQNAAELPKVDECPSSEKSVMVKKKDKRLFGWCTVL